MHDLHVQVYVNGKLVLDGKGIVDHGDEDEVELIVQDQEGHPFVVQVPTIE